MAIAPATSARGGTVAAAPAGRAATAERTLRRKAGAENFPVALRVLPAHLRVDLAAVYGVARVLDDLGDTGAQPGCRAGSERTALLTDFRLDLASVWDASLGEPEHPVLRQLVPTVRARGLDHEPFDRLVQANLLDQRVSRYADYAELRGYCALSAEPVGRIVLAIFGEHSAAAVEYSDRICAALQLIEHWQDVAEDRRAGRVYLPQEDLAAFGVPETDLDAVVASPALRRLMAFQIDRAAELLGSGTPLVGLLRGWSRLAVAGYVAGGRATLDALRRADGDVLAGPPRLRRRDLLWHLACLLLSAMLGCLQERPTPPRRVFSDYQPPHDPSGHQPPARSGALR